MRADDLRRVLSQAAEEVRAYRRNKLLSQRAAAANKALLTASVHVAPIGPELKTRVLLLMAEVERSALPFARGDRWAIVREVASLRSGGVPQHVIARHLLHLGICKGDGKAAEVSACITWMRQERHRWRNSSRTAAGSETIEK